MRASFTLVLGLILLVAPAAALAKEISRELAVDGWTCEGCAARTEKVVRALKGVKDAKANLDKKLVAVTYDDAQTGPDAIRAAITKAGFSCPLPKSK
ncbi:MAG: heavy-metal-associated domain-containing protein [Myxococcota bacterium]